MTTTPAKGLLVSIQGTDCTNGGATSGHRQAVLIGPGIPEIFSPGPYAPALRLDFDLTPKGAAPGALLVARPDWLRAIGENVPRFVEWDCLRDDYSHAHRIVRAVARPADGSGQMFGGHWIHTSDSRFPFTSPIPVHDRSE